MPSSRLSALGPILLGLAVSLASLSAQAALRIGRSRAASRTPP